MIEICNIKTDRCGEFAYDRQVCRGKSPLGNPFTLKRESDRDKVCDAYELWFYENFNRLLPSLLDLYMINRQCGNLRLFCWCAPKRCHATTIKQWLESQLL